MTMMDSVQILFHDTALASEDEETVLNDTSIRKIAVKNPENLLYTSLADKKEVYLLVNRWEMVRVCLLLVGGLELLSAFLGNTFVIYCYIRNWKKNTVLTFHLLSLAIGDLTFTLLVTVPLYISLAADLEWPLDEAVCPLVSIALYALGIYCMVMSLIICYDRIQVVSLSLSPHIPASRIWDYLITSLCWLLCIGVAVALKLALQYKVLVRPAIYYSYDGYAHCDYMLRSSTFILEIILIILAAFPLAFLLCMHLALRLKVAASSDTDFRTRGSVAKKKDKGKNQVMIDFPVHSMPSNVHSDEMDVDFGSLMRTSLYRLSIHSYGDVWRARMRRQSVVSRAETFLVISTFAFLVSWVPYTVVLCVHENRPELVDQVVASICLGLFLLRPAINPFLYAGNTSSMARIYSSTVNNARVQCRRLLCFCLCCLCANKEQQHNLKPAPRSLECSRSIDTDCMAPSIKILHRDPKHSIRRASQVIIPLGTATSGPVEVLPKTHSKSSLFSTPSRDRMRRVPVRKGSSRWLYPLPSIEGGIDQSQPSEQDYKIYSCVTESYIF